MDHISPTPVAWYGCYFKSRGLKTYLGKVGSLYATVARGAKLESPMPSWQGMYRLVACLP